MPRSVVGFELALPDFTDCRFASREPDSDWFAVVHSGGPARAFSEIMPAFGEALTDAEMRLTVAHLRTFCRNRAWPQGDLNLPRAFFTEKAFPEDEAVITTSIGAERPFSTGMELLYERRFGPRNQVELKIPLAALQALNGGWHAGVGDIGLGFKRALFHSMRTGSIFSAGGEVVLPSGNKNNGLGKGYTVFEGFAAFGQILPSDGFLQAQAGIEAPRNSSRAAKEAFWRIAGGRTFAQGRGLGRSWTPMVELLAAREWETGARINWDVVPQMQVSLSTRQHILLNLGVRVPVNGFRPRQTQLMFYLLWDWFDGGLRDGW